MTKKAATLKNLKVRVNTDGTLSKKSLEDVQGLVKPHPLEKLIPRVTPNDIKDGATFVGLTVAIRFGIMDPLSFLLGQDWFPGKNVATVIEEFKEGIRTALGDPTEVRKGAIVFELQQLKLIKIGAPTEEFRKAIEEKEFELLRELTALPEPRDEISLLEFEKWFLEHKSALMWATSMGTAGLAMKLAESHTVSDLVELVPGQ